MNTFFLFSFLKMSLEKAIDLSSYEISEEEYSSLPRPIRDSMAVIAHVFTNEIEFLYNLPLNEKKRWFLRVKTLKRKTITIILDFMDFDDRKIIRVRCALCNANKVFRLLCIESINKKLLPLLPL